MTGSHDHANSAFARALAVDEFVVTMEVAQPVGSDAAQFVADMQRLDASGVRFVNVPDAPLARSRMSAVAAARLVQDHTGIEAIAHVATRDRNAIALRGDIVGAHALGVRNVLALGGDPVALGDQSGASDVRDLTSYALIELIRDVAPSTCVGCVVNPMAPDIDAELERLQRKLAAGAAYVITQPVFDAADLDAFFTRSGALPVPVLAGVVPLRSAAHATYLHTRVPGIDVPERTRAALDAAGSDTAAAAIGVDMARCVADELRARVGGLYLVPSAGRYDACIELLEAIRA